MLTSLNMNNSLSVFAEDQAAEPARFTFCSLLYMLEGIWLESVHES